MCNFDSDVFRSVEVPSRPMRKLKQFIAVNETPCHCYGMSLAIRDHTVLPSTRHKWAHPPLLQPDRLVLDLPIPEGWKAELSYRYIPTWFTRPQTVTHVHKSDALTTIPPSNPVRVTSATTTKSAVYALHRWCLRRILHIHCTDFVSQWWGSVTYGTTAPVRYYPSTALVFLWSSVPCRRRSRPLPSSPGLHSGSSQRLVTKNWKTEANLAENGWGMRMICARSTLAWRRQDGALWIDRHGVYSWMRLRPRDTLHRDREKERERERERERESII